MLGQMGGWVERGATPAPTLRPALAGQPAPTSQPCCYEICLKTVNTEFAYGEDLKTVILCLGLKIFIYKNILPLVSNIIEHLAFFVSLTLS